jgi:endonuclease IV
MKFELTNPQITLIKQIIERDLYNQTNQLKEYKICLEEGFTCHDEYNLKISQEELQKRIDSLQILINHLETLDEMFSKGINI